MSKRPTKPSFLSRLYTFIIRAGGCLLICCAVYVGIVKGVLANPVHITISQGK